MNHHGLKVDSGHYTSICKRSPNFLVNSDDKQCKDVYREFIFETQAYVLAYEKVTLEKSNANYNVVSEMSSVQELSEMNLKKTDIKMSPHNRSPCNISKDPSFKNRDSTFCDLPSKSKIKIEEKNIKKLS